MDLATIVQTAFLGGMAIEAALMVSLLLTRDNKVANRLLCVHMLSVAHIQVMNYLDYTGFIENIPYLSYSGLSAGLLSIAALYLYLCALTDPGFKLMKRNYLHFVPALLAAIWWGWTVSLRVPGAKVLTPDFFWGRTIRGVFALGLFAVYYYAAFRHMKRYRNSLPQYFSDFTRVRLTWLNVLFGCSLALWCVVLTDLLMGVEVALWNVMILLITAETFIVAIFSLRQSAVFLEREKESDALPAIEEKKRALRENLYAPEDLSRETQRLRQYLASQKPYLNPELRLSELADALGLKSYQLTEIINRGEGKNFYELVNSFRVEEFKRRAADPAHSHLSLLGLAMDSGFNSKSVFNETFRKMTGQTPSEYRSTHSPKSTN